MPVVPSVRERLCFALDYPTLDDALEAATLLRHHVGVFKVGLELFLRSGPEAVREIKKLGPKVFLDLKLHDIPATVAAAVGSACALEVDYLTLHASGGPQMLGLAAKHVEGSELKLLAVTVLTSMNATELHEIGVRATEREQVEALSRMAVDCGVSGLVCSPLEATSLRTTLGAHPMLVTPGIRPADADPGDQKRFTSPVDAVRSGSDLLVVGRPIRTAPDPLMAAQAILTQMERALEQDS